MKPNRGEVSTQQGIHAVHLLAVQLLALSFATSIAAACGTPTGDSNTVPKAFKPAEYLARAREAYAGEHSEEVMAYLTTFVKEFAVDLPLRAGMTRQQVREISERRGYGKHVPLRRLSPDERVFSEDTSIATYLVNGRQQFWVDIAFDRNRVSSIFIVPGNMSSVFLPLRFDGEAPHKGMWSALSDAK